MSAHKRIVNLINELTKDETEKGFINSQEILCIK